MSTRDKEARRPRANSSLQQSRELTFRDILSPRTSSAIQYLIPGRTTKVKLIDILAAEKTSQRQFADAAGICMCVYVCTCMFVNVCVCLCINVCICIYLYVSVCLCTYIFLSVCVFVWMYVCLCSRVKVSARCRGQVGFGYIVFGLGFIVTPWITPSQ